MHSFNLPILAEFSSQSLSPWSFNRQIAERLEAADLSSKSMRILCRCHKGCALQLLFGSLVRCPAILGCPKGPGGRVLATRPRRLQREPSWKTAFPAHLLTLRDCSVHPTASLSVRCRSRRIDKCTLPHYSITCTCRRASLEIQRYFGLSLDYVEAWIARPRSWATPPQRHVDLTARSLARETSERTFSRDCDSASSASDEEDPSRNPIGYEAPRETGKGIHLQARSRTNLVWPVEDLDSPSDQLPFSRPNQLCSKANDHHPFNLGVYRGNRLFILIWLKIFSSSYRPSIFHWCWFSLRERKAQFSGLWASPTATFLRRCIPIQARAYWAWKPPDNAESAPKRATAFWKSPERGRSRWLREGRLCGDIPQLYQAWVWILLA